MNIGVPIEVAAVDAASAPRPLTVGSRPLPSSFAGALIGVTPNGAVVPRIGRSPFGLLYFPRDGSEPVSLAESGGQPAVSPDGRFVAYTRRSTDPSASRVVMVAAIPPAQGTWEIGPGNNPKWSGDSRTLFFSEPQLAYETRAPKVLKVAVEPGAAFRAGPVTVAGLPPANATPQWEIGPNDGRLYWLTNTARRQTIFVHNFARLVDSLVSRAGAPAAK
jgi:hypothetical protein